jgi:3-hydroxyisobutyrate dehydrogenase
VAKEIAAASPCRVKAVIDTSTIGIKAAQAVAATLLPAGIAFVDAPVSGGTAGADNATIAIMMACSADDYERLRPLMSLMGKPFYVGPKPGQGQAVKILNNFLSATALAATSEAVDFGIRQGIEMKTILDIVNASTGRNSATEDKFPQRILPGRRDAGFTAKLQLKDIRLYLENARAAGVADEIAGAVVAVWDRLEHDRPGADIIEMYPYTQNGRGKAKRG